jgi:hypothetical protein
MAKNLYNHRFLLNFRVKPGTRYCKHYLRSQIQHVVLQPYQFIKQNSKDNFTDTITGIELDKVTTKKTWYIF